MAVERNRSHDGIELPALVRECIDYIEEFGKSAGLFGHLVIACVKFLSVFKLQLPLVQYVNARLNFYRYANLGVPFLFQVWFIFRV